MKADVTIQDRLRRVMRWPLYPVPLLLLITILVFGISRFSGCLVAAFDLFYLVFAVRWYMTWKRQTEDELADYAADFQKEQKEQMENLPVPYAVLAENGELMWFNQEFRALLPEKEGGFTVQDMLPMLGRNLPDNDSRLVEHIRWKDRAYQAELQRVSEDARMYSFFLFDETGELDALEKLERQEAVIGQVCIDNYEEVMSSAEQVRQSLLAALIERKVSKYFSNYGGVVLKTDKDRFTVFLQKEGLKEVMEDRFSLLEDVKAVNIGNNIAVTLSISMGAGGRNLEQDNEFARNAMNLALGRGGDQAIVRTKDSTRYFGGKTQKQEKSTRVKARVKAQALRELMLGKDTVLIMGHHLPDMDSFGAAVGVWTAARSLDKKAHIVMGGISSSLRPIVDRFRGTKDYPSDMIIRDDEAKTMRNARTMIVVVDANRPSYTECPELLEKAGTVVVIDHHRQGTEVIRNATLSYIEPYASSASEMVSEILQYFGDNVDINPIIAETIYAGIVMDTDNFVAKTGVRTFEAAAFLRRQGADVTRVRKLFREKMEDSQAKAATVSSAEIFEGCIAMGICDGNGIESPTVVGAQAANEMLDIVGVKASVVFTEYEETIYVSARSIDEVNVQLIMERIGGGGHLSIAGAQLHNMTVQQAKKKVQQVILDMIREGALQLN